MVSKDSVIKIMRFDLLCLSNVCALATMQNAQKVINVCVMLHVRELISNFKGQLSIL